MSSDYHRTVLPCGLRIVTEHVPGVRSATVGLWVGIGSRDEQPALAGAAHYLEHLLFKGTARRSALRIAEEIDAVGGEFNAFTAQEHTCFYAQVLDTDLPLAVDLVTDVVLDAVCADADMETERSVVLEEIAMRDDDPEDQLQDLFLDALFGEHPLGRPILGTEQSITEMRADALRQFYRERYQLATMVFAAAGNIEHDTVVRLVEQALADQSAAQFAAAPVAPRTGEADIKPAGDLVVHAQDTELAHVMVGVPGVTRRDERRYPLSVLNAALGGGMSSRLFQQVREQRGLAYQVYSSMNCYSDTGQLSVYAGCQPERLGDLGAVLRAVLGEVADGGLTDDEVSRGKGQLRGGLVLGLEDTASRMSRLGKNELNYGRQFSVDETISRIDTVSTADVAEVARTVLDGARTLAVLGPYAHAEDLPNELRELV